MNRRQFNGVLFGAAFAATQTDPAEAGRRRPQAAAAGAQPPVHDVVELLRWMVRIDTQNPPPDGQWRETEMNAALGNALAHEGIQARVIESAPGRGQLVARLKGNGSRPPLLLSTHIDVVGADARQWRHPPFSGHSDGEFIHGRGTLDNKAMAAALVHVFHRLAREKANRSRDLILCLVGDEESGGAQGMRFLLEKHWGEIDSQVALAEGDPPLLNGGGQVDYIPIQCAEKKSYTVRLRCRGTAGHASTPLADNPIVALARAVAPLHPFSTRVHTTDLAREYLRRMARFEPQDLARHLTDVASLGEAAHPDALDAVTRANPVYNALLRATVCPTILKAGTRSNVIPVEAECVINCRLLPDQQIESLIAELGELTGCDPGSFSADPPSPYDGPATPHDTPEFRALEEISTKLWPACATVPYMAPAASDARYLRSRGVSVYGVFPFPATRKEFEAIHAPDERIRIASLRQGTQWLYEVTTALSV